MHISLLCLSCILHRSPGHQLGPCRVQATDLPVSWARYELVPCLAGGQAPSRQPRQAKLRLSDVGPHLVGMHLFLLWPDDGSWWPALLTHLDLQQRRATLLYNTGAARGLCQARSGCVCMCTSGLGVVCRCGGVCGDGDATYLPMQGICQVSASNSSSAGARCSGKLGVHRRGILWVML